MRETTYIHYLLWELLYIYTQTEQNVCISYVHISAFKEHINWHVSVCWIRLNRISVTTLSIFWFEHVPAGVFIIIGLIAIITHPLNQWTYFLKEYTNF